MDSLWKRVLAGAMTVVIFCNNNVLTFSAAGIGTLMVSKPTYAFAYSPIMNDQDDLFNKLKDKYNTDDPDRNYNSPNDLLNKLNNQEPPNSRDLTNKLQSMLQSNSGAGDVDLSDQTEDFDQEGAMESYTQSALTVGQTHGAPSTNAAGNTSVQYTNESPVEVVRNPETGELEVRTKEDLSGIETNSNGLSGSEMHSAQIDHEDTSFEAKDAHGDNEKIYATGAQTHTKLKSSSTRTGEALGYQTITNSADSAINTEVPDSVLQPAFNSLENATSDSGSFLNGCTTTTSTETTELYSPDIVKEMCHDLNKDNLGFCEIERRLRVPVIAGGEGFTSCGPGCFAVKLGSETESHKASSDCSLFQEEREVMINLQEGVSITKVEVEGGVDDHTRISINNQPVYSVVYGEHGTDLELPETGPNAPWCETSQLWEYEADITELAHPLMDLHEGELTPIKINMDTATRHWGKHFVSVKFYFETDDASGFGQVLEDYPAGCAAEAGINLPESIPFTTPGSGGGASPGGGGGGGGGGIEPTPPSVKPLSTSTPTSTAHILPPPGDIGPGMSCRFDGYQTIDEGTKGFPQEYLDGIGPFYEGDEGNASWEVNLEGYRCDPFDGEEYCVNDNGEQKCFTWDEFQEMDVPESCAEFKENEQCSEISRECVPGWYDETQGICFNEEVEYECDYGDDVSFEYESTENTCDTMIPCAGGDCGPDNEETNDRFVEAMGMASVMEHMKSDSSCTNPEDPSTCRIFEGEYEYCSWEVTGMGNNCCEAPAGVSFIDYINFSQAMMKFDNKVFDGQYLNAAKEGAYDLVKEGASNVYEYFSGEPLASVGESVVGNLGGYVADSSGELVQHTFGEGIMGAVQQQVSQWIYDALPQALADTLFATGTGTASSTVTGLSGPMQTAANVFGYIMIAYMVYQLVNLAAMLLTACDENEEDVGLKLEMRQCFEISEKYCVSEVLNVCFVRQKDHCCYSSMLARIIMEQAAPLLGKDMGQCEGLTPEELGNLDFDQIDLSEWTSTMIEQDMVPENNEQSLTVDGRMDNAPGRDTATERNSKRAEGMSDVNKEATEEIKNSPLDCSIHPRPAVCEFGFDPTSGGGG